MSATSTLDPIEAAAAALDAAEARPRRARGRRPGAGRRPRAAPAPSLDKPFIQIGIFSVESNADNTAETLRKAGMVPTVKEGKMSGKAFWRVIVGPATTTAERATLAREDQGRSGSTTPIVRHQLTGRPTAPVARARKGRTSLPMTAAERLPDRSALLPPRAARGSLAALPARAFETKARAALVYDLTTNTVLLEKNADVPLPPASMSKLMTLNMLFEALADGRVTLDTRFAVSERAQAMGGSTMFLNTTDRPTVEELIQGHHRQFRQRRLRGRRRRARRRPRRPSRR